MMQEVAAIIVTHNSELVLSPCIEALRRQTVAVREIIIVDCASDDRAALHFLGTTEGVKVIESENVGFSRANNIGMEHVSLQADFVIFLNPDTFLSSDFVEKSLVFCRHYPQVGMISGKLNGYDIGQHKPTGRLDSTGVFRKWYGRWFDRGQGETDCGQYDTPAFVPALCGALLFCRRAALQALHGPVFDPDFFLYKEDIDLSLRMRKAGWQLLYHPDLLAFHCRGWSKNRGAIPVKLRRMAAANEVLLYKKHPSPYMMWACLKYLLVRFFGL